MRAGEITLEAMGEGHLDGALRLSREAGWPHRREDWALVLSVSDGLVATADGALAGTAMTTCFDDRVAAVNMVIVDAAMRGRGLGRRLMEAALRRAGARSCRLVATAEGLPLYEKLGFAATGEIVQQQGIARAVAEPAGVDRARPDDFARIAGLDAAARGFRREAVMRALNRHARFAVIRERGTVEAFAALRRFGRGSVIGPVVARSHGEALRLLDALLAGEAGTFVRVDTDEAAGLGPALAERGLFPAGGGVAMRRGSAPAPSDAPYRPFALASQALG
ncbi:N-acetyltransferase [Aureimonas flava]|uniref:N-acetyltransferase n=1 Tax=Aureimonas flava TaxID=2320271 RepID=A0A3A1WW72_9HYPH|nr:GNAT family N-acetyltransferase [Aureimonas flava]RIY02618.1 N-acetyltransferase [Aureimonas flava]